MVYISSIWGKMHKENKANHQKKMYNMTAFS